MDIIVLWIGVCVVDWTVEMSAIASNEADQIFVHN